MKYLAFIVVAAILLGAAIYFGNSQKNTNPTSQLTQQTQNKQTTNEATNETTTIVAENLETPWAITILPDNSMLVTERAGRVRLINNNGELQNDPVATIEAVEEIGEGGLLGIAAHPNFATNRYVYLYYTYGKSGGNTKNRVVRMTFNNNILSDEKIILDNIPGASNHDGGRIKFGPDGNLYIGTGDAQDPSQSQNRNTLGGKILRITPDGTAAPGNPFDSPVYTYGHRNVQGLAWNSNGQFWATEHGRSGGGSGLDELNLIEPGKNYGWPEIEGDETRSGMVTPKRNSGPTTTWAPSGAAFVGDSLFFSGLRGQTLYEAVIQTGEVVEVKEHFGQQYGRIREVIAGPDGMLYISTSNRDGRGNPQRGDDKIIQVNPDRL